MSAETKQMYNTLVYEPEIIYNNLSLHASPISATNEDLDEHVTNTEAFAVTITANDPPLVEDKLSS